MFFFFLVRALGWSLDRSLHLAMVPQQSVSWLNSQWVDQQFYFMQEYRCAVM